MRNVTLVIALFACVGPGNLSLQSKGGQQSPKEVVEEFCKFETAGGRLTTEGWNKAERFFASSLPTPKTKTILVTAKGYYVRDAIFRSEDRADVVVEMTGSIWKIDSRMGLSLSSPDQLESFLSYPVIRIKNNSESGRGAGASHDVSGSPEWKIEGAGTSIWLTADTAVKYVTQIRAHTSDPVVKQNAEKTLIRLKQLLR